MYNSLVTTAGASFGIYLVLPMASGWLVAIAVVQAAFFSNGKPGRLLELKTKRPRNSGTFRRSDGAVRRAD
jgi:hypothetical protein